MPSNTQTTITEKMPKIRFIANLSKMGKKKLVIYIPINEHDKLLNAFKDKHMIVTCEEAIKEETEK